uniref:Uncharacterized protein n=1 Tax=Octopus bimaculoides TaxID=37653 RepID=A0A0L8HMS4_OCTBM
MWLVSNPLSLMSPFCTLCLCLLDVPYRHVSLVSLHRHTMSMHRAAALRE